MSQAGTEVRVNTSQEAVWEQAYEDLEWARTSREIRQQFPGKVVVVNNKCVVADGEDRAEALREAKGKGYSRGELVVVVVQPPNLVETSPDTAVPLDKTSLHANRTENPA